RAAAERAVAAAVTGQPSQATAAAAEAAIGKGTAAPADAARGTRDDGTSASHRPAATAAHAAAAPTAVAPAGTAEPPDPDAAAAADCAVRDEMHVVERDRGGTSHEESPAQSRPPAAWSVRVSSVATLGSGVGDREVADHRAPRIGEQAAELAGPGDRIAVAVDGD